MDKNTNEKRANLQQIAEKSGIGLLTNQINKGASSGKYKGVMDNINQGGDIPAIFTNFKTKLWGK